MKLRREVRERLNSIAATRSEHARNIEASTISVSEFAFYTGTTPAFVRKEIVAGTLPTRMFGKRRRIRITPEVRQRIVAGFERFE